MLELLGPLSTATIIVLAAIQIASLLFLLLVFYSFRISVKSRSAFFKAVAGNKPSGMFLWCNILLIAYSITVLIVMIGFDLLFFFAPHLL